MREYSCMRSRTNNSTVAVTSVLSNALDTQVEELPPLSRRIDLDALDRIVSSDDGPRPPGVLVTFEYAGLTVAVHSCGIVYATPIDDGGEPDRNCRDFNP